MKIQIAAVAAAALVAACARPPAPLVEAPGSVSGTLRVVNEGAEGYSGLGRAVVYLESRGDVADVRVPEPARVRHPGHGFEPSLLALGRGRGLELENASVVHHVVFWLVEGRRREVELPPGTTVPLELHARMPRTVRFYCELHHDEHFTVLVLPSPHHAEVGSGGDFVIGGVPAGHWELHLWSEALEGRIREFELGPGAVSQQDIWIDARRVVKR